MSVDFTTRVLPPAEWGRLAETELGPALTAINPEAMTVLVAEDREGAIVGCWSLITFAHVEGLWVAPAHRRRGRVLVRLWEALRQIALPRGIEAVFTAAASDEIRRLLLARGAREFPSTYVLPLLPLRD